jgi:AcrR family transcriptional regulator
MSTMTSATSTRVRRPAAVTREHLLDVAEDLFYRYGIHVTGVDAIAGRAGVAPTTLYRLFGSKDELVAAYVERYAAGYQGWIESMTSDSRLSARERILAFFDALTDVTRPETFRGCPFLMTLAEYPDPACAAHASAQAVKAWVRDKLRELAAELPHQTSATVPVLADQLALVVEGLYASIAALGSNGPARHARALAAVVLDAHQSSHDRISTLEPA